MSRISVTRMELLSRQAQLKLASEGRDLLEQKRTALLKEFLRTADTALERSNTLDRAAADARYTLARAEAVAGSEAVRSAALAARAELQLQVVTRRVMGVRAPHIEQARAARRGPGKGAALARTSTTLVEAASAFEGEVAAILALAETELRLKRLAAEIQRTARRLNALDHFLIPRLKSECAFIQMALDERERADHFRMKLVKRTLERKRG